MPNKEDFTKEIERLMQEAKSKGMDYVDIVKQAILSCADKTIYCDDEIDLDKLIEDLHKYSKVKLEIVGRANVNYWGGNVIPQIFIDDYEVKDDALGF